MTGEELTARFSQRFGTEAAPELSYGQLTVDVPASVWIDALTFARDELGCSFFDWLTGVDELDEGFSIVVHLWSPAERHHVLLRTRVTRDAPVLPSATGVFRGANWHERETYEMFGVQFSGHPNLVPLLLPDGFEGNPLRKEFVLAARAAKNLPSAKEPSEALLCGVFFLPPPPPKTWPGAKEPGESDRDTAAAPARRRMLPPGVPDPQTWGPRPPAAPDSPDSASEPEVTG
jgi:NADH-quinone oxidoreductase subunit C